jgi:hypothetical protein
MLWRCIQRVPTMVCGAFATLADSAGVDLSELGDRVAGSGDRHMPTLLRSRRRQRQRLAFQLAIDVCSSWRQRQPQ